MEKAKIRPLATPKPLNRFSQILAGVITFWMPPGMALYHQFSSASTTFSKYRQKTYTYRATIIKSILVTQCLFVCSRIQKINTSLAHLHTNHLLLPNTEETTSNIRLPVLLRNNCAFCIFRKQLLQKCWKCDTGKYGNGDYRKIKLTCVILYVCTVQFVCQVL